MSSGRKCPKKKDMLASALRTNLDIKNNNE